LTSEAANVWQAGEVSFASANEEDGNSNVQQQHRFASFNKALEHADGGKRTVPSGPNLIHDFFNFEFFNSILQK
ncbi:hypothetical protein BAE44_0009163, partial [Dichanthelium oligosanthes]